MPRFQTNCWSGAIGGLLAGLSLLGQPGAGYAQSSVPEEFFTSEEYRNFPCEQFRDNPTQEIYLPIGQDEFRTTTTGALCNALALNQNPNTDPTRAATWGLPYLQNGNICRDRNSGTDVVCVAPPAANMLRWTTP